MAIGRPKAALVLTPDEERELFELSAAGHRDLSAPIRQTLNLVRGQEGSALSRARARDELVGAETVRQKVLSDPGTPFSTTRRDTDSAFIGVTESYAGHRFEATLGARPLPQSQTLLIAGSPRASRASFTGCE